MLGFQEVLAAAKLLSAEDRSRLMESLWDEVSPTEWPVPTQAWIDQCQRRSELFDRGEMPAGTWQEVKQRSRHRAGLDG
jgi:putative addiction module component (TIGR02574 family)